ncbi:rna-directed dna polymerase from mobile element jockey- hypothetical protein [Limosa lapponica baueri]|uniref:Rna-directed dna polymerase from mobile element jockey-like n=1 Tax=Limosa lapponica baueri TaxID=1758121 RepID=A0A2I0TZU7_LIMLA|nr:rna-directed dna polymerase from mobile element jockey- hypothetical protein [Limosa lapponica baueri]
MKAKSISMPEHTSDEKSMLVKRYKAISLLHSALRYAGVRFTSPPCMRSKTKPDGNYEDELRCLKGTIKTRQANYARLQGSVLGSVLSNVFINDLDDGTQCNLSNFADNTKLGGAMDMLDGSAAHKRDLNRQEKWANRNFEAYNKSKCKFLHLEWNASLQPRQTGANCLGSRSEGPGRQVLLNQQCAYGSKKASFNLGSISVASR